MATVRREVVVEVQPEAVWDVLRDVGSVHTRLAPGFVTATRLDGDTRTVTFVNGVTVSEQIVSVDDQERRLAYTVVGGTARHHNASFEVFEEAHGSRVVWTTDVLPHAAADVVAPLMDAGAAAIAAALATARPTPAAPRR
jgi:carbon monoxide dehydrogenase subunit G